MAQALRRNIFETNLDETLFCMIDVAPSGCSLERHSSKPAALCSIVNKESSMSDTDMNSLTPEPIPTEMPELWPAYVAPTLTKIFAQSTEGGEGFYSDGFSAPSASGGA
jgi:hypothetical protein